MPDASDRSGEASGKTGLFRFRDACESVADRSSKRFRVEQAVGSTKSPVRQEHLGGCASAASPWWRTGRMFARKSVSTGNARHRGGLGCEVNLSDNYGDKGVRELEFFAGIDWDRSVHEVCMIGADGEVLGQWRLGHGGEGLIEMVRWMAKTADADRCVD